MSLTKYQTLCRFALGTALVCSLAALAGAAESWPVYPLESNDPKGDYKLDQLAGPGGYFSMIKIALLWGIFLCWVKTTQWASKDCSETGMPYAMWTPIVFGPFILGFLLALTIPWFWLGFPLLLLTYGGSLGAYIYKRNAQVEPHERLLTRDHLRFLMSQHGGKVGVKIEAEKKLDWQQGPQIDFKPIRRGADEADIQGALISARQSEGYIPFKELLAEALTRGSKKIMLDFTREQVNIKFQIDGVWHNADPPAVEREQGDPILAACKMLTMLDPKQRRQPQTGRMTFTYENKKYPCEVSSRGVKTGERVLVKMVDTELAIESLEEAGMRGKIRQQVAEISEQKSGFFLFCGMAENGLSTTKALAFRSMDRFMRDFFAVESKDDPEPYVENVEPVPFDPMENQTPADVLPRLFRREPEVVICHDLSDEQTVQLLIDEATEDRFVFGSITAKDAAEGLLRVLMLKIPATEFAPVCRGALSVRLIRKLCEDCKEEYTPSAALLKKLGLPGKVQSLYRPPAEPENPKDICITCGGLGYQGQTGIFELLLVGDNVRNALIKQPKLETVKAMARRDGNATIQEEGLRLVVRGITSLPELQRVLKL